MSITVSVAVVSHCGGGSGAFIAMPVCMAGMPTTPALNQMPGPVLTIIGTPA
jgi:hypothetical protein